jgi:hypothetical protein
MQSGDADRNEGSQYRYKELFSVCGAVAACRDIPRNHGIVDTPDRKREMKGFALVRMETPYCVQTIKLAEMYAPFLQRTAAAE